MWQRKRDTLVTKSLENIECGNGEEALLTKSLDNIECGKRRREAPLTESLDNIECGNRVERPCLQKYWIL